MNGNEQYQSQALACAKQLRDLIVPFNAAVPATRSPGVSGEELAAISEGVTGILDRAGGITAAVLETGSAAEQEAAELRLLAQAAAEIKLAGGLLQAAHDFKEGSELDSTTRAGDAGISQSIEEIARLLETPLGVEFAATETRGPQDRPQEFGAAKMDLHSEAERSLRVISKQAARVSSKAVQALLAFDPAILKKGLAGFSKDAAEVIDSVVNAVSKFVRRIAQAAASLLLQVHEWVLRLLGKDLEGKARKQISDWLDKWVKGEDEQTLTERLVEAVFAVETIRTETDAWLKDTKAPTRQINQAAESVQALADKYKTKAEQVEKFLKGIGLLKLTPISSLPQIQMVIAGVVACLLGYVVYTGYDHVDSGRIVFLERFGVEIPDRVQGVRATVKTALAAN